MREFLNELKIKLNQKSKFFSKSNLKKELKEFRTFFFFALLYTFIPVALEYALFYPNVSLFNGFAIVTSLLGTFYTFIQMAEWQARNDLKKEDKITWLKENQTAMKDNLFKFQLIHQLSTHSHMINYFNQTTIEKILKQIDNKIIDDATFNAIANFSYHPDKLFSFLSNNEMYWNESVEELSIKLKTQLYEGFKSYQKHHENQVEKLNNYFSKELEVEKNIFKQAKKLSMKI
jgi:hypothetical protein